MIDKKEQGAFYKMVGCREGELDILNTNNFTTIKDRAERAFYSMGCRAYKKQFVAGYTKAASTK